MAQPQPNANPRGKTRKTPNKTRFILLIATLALGVGMLLLSSLNQDEEEPTTPEEIKAAILEHRKEQNENYRTSEDSPIPPKERNTFGKLAYYPVDLSFRVQAQLVQHEKAGQPAAIKNGEGLRVAGKLKFELKGKSHTLLAYNYEGASEEELFVPFIDATAGDETYGGGRYLNLKAKEDGSVTLDFNYAYNPSCAYNADYICPKPPDENHLMLAIEAGEKNYPLAP